MEAIEFGHGRWLHSISVNSADGLLHMEGMKVGRKPGAYSGAVPAASRLHRTCFYWKYLPRVGLHLPDGLKSEQANRQAPSKQWPCLVKLFNSSSSPSIDHRRQEILKHRTTKDATKTRNGHHYRPHRAKRGRGSTKFQGACKAAPLAALGLGRGGEGEDETETETTLQSSSLAQKLTVPRSVASVLQLVRYLRRSVFLLSTAVTTHHQLAPAALQNEVQRISQMQHTRTGC
ncbi:hypothetical protein CSOJ01_01357 [Colletotrichum sojae]|uniref:Uncharacterized protein n=1 Tax=Colletotrichum sojae TaxID=2175907 RepID=A0A8H6JV00_9PEZI|nr:hypothetical protein CSOJ01_01357 [Colletotrichum sojae]